MAELVDARGLGPRGCKPWGFESLRPHSAGSPHPGEETHPGRGVLSRAMLVRRVLVAVVAVVGAGLAVCPAAGAQSADRWVTIAARECDSYTDIRANLARNNIMESLQDLGADTLYTSGEPIDPRTELEGQPNCRPIVGWRFMTGTGYQSRAVSGPWGIAVDRHRRRLRRADRDQGGGAARDFDGHPVSGGAKIAGAVTVGLNRDQADRADQNRLWLQGGTPDGSDALRRPAVHRAATGSARCAARSTTSTATTSRPSSSRPARGTCTATRTTSRRRRRRGTIVIRKQVAGSERERELPLRRQRVLQRRRRVRPVRRRGRPGVDGVHPRRDPRRRRAVDGHRGRPRGLDADRPGVRVAVEHDDGRRRDAHRADQPGRGRHRDVHVHEPAHAAGRRARACARSPATAPGTFPFRVLDDGRRRRSPAATCTTRSTGGVGGVGAIKLDPGRYRIAERRRSSRGRRVAAVAASSCNGERRPVGSTVFVDITAGRAPSARSRTASTGPAAISDRRGLDRRRSTPRGTSVSPAARAEGRAPPVRHHDPSGRARGRVGPAHATSSRSAATCSSRAPRTRTKARMWSLIAVTCNGRVVPFEQGRVTVRITADTPRAALHASSTCASASPGRRLPTPTGPCPSPSPAHGPGPGARARRRPTSRSRKHPRRLQRRRADLPPARHEPLRRDAPRGSSSPTGCRPAPRSSAPARARAAAPRAASGCSCARSATSRRASRPPSGSASSASTAAPGSTPPWSAPAAPRTCCATTSRPPASRPLRAQPPRACPSCGGPGRARRLLAQQPRERGDGRQQHGDGAEHDLEPEAEQERDVLAAQVGLARPLERSIR